MAVQQDDGFGLRRPPDAGRGVPPGGDQQRPVRTPGERGDAVGVALEFGDAACGVTASQTRTTRSSPAVARYSPRRRERDRRHRLPGVGVDLAAELLAWPRPRTAPCRRRGRWPTVRPSRAEGHRRHPRVLLDAGGASCAGRDVPEHEVVVAAGQQRARPGLKPRASRGRCRKCAAEQLAVGRPVPQHARPRRSTTGCRRRRRPRPRCRRRCGTAARRRRGGRAGEGGEGAMSGAAVGRGVDMTAGPFSRSG